MSVLRNLLPDKRLLFLTQEDDQQFGLGPMHLYKTNVVVYSCVSLIAKNIASTKWKLNNGDKSFDSLLHAPNNGQSKESFLEELIKTLLLSGQVHIYKEESSWHLVKGAQKHKDHYLFNGLKLPVADVLCISIGLSPCSVVSKTAQFHDLVTEHNISILKKGGRPSGVLTVDSKNLNAEKFRNLEDNIRAWNTGPKNAGELLVLTSECNWQEMGLKPMDTNFLQGQHAAARQIAQAFGVPPMLVGIQGDATFSNYKEARLHFWEDTILPLMNKVCGEITRWFFDKHNARLEFDLNDIQALEPKRNAELEQMDKISFLTVNEKRERFGYAPREIQQSRTISESKVECGDNGRDSGHKHDTSIQNIADTD